MKCLKPITLKNGLVVPCGKCELCLSHRRDNWSIRLQLHTESYANMPMFILVTYDDNHVPYGDGEPSLYRRDIALFIKRYKDKYGLYNSDWSYFGCGEYGLNGTKRPHYHLLIFGDDELTRLYWSDYSKAKERLESCWTDKNGEKLGFISVGVAEWSGIHYVTKYVLKEDPDDYNGEVKVKPFTFCSNGIGMHWLKTDEAIKMKTQLERVSVWRKEYLPLFDAVSIDPSDINHTIMNLKRFFDSMPDYPDFKVILSNGSKVFLPREIRRKLVGSFEHFKDSPLWNP